MSCNSHYFAKKAAFYLAYQVKRFCDQDISRCLDIIFENLICKI